MFVDPHEGLGYLWRVVVRVAAMEVGDALLVVLNLCTDCPSHDPRDSSRSRLLRSLFRGGVATSLHPPLPKRLRRERRQFPLARNSEEFRPATASRRAPSRNSSSVGTSTRAGESAVVREDAIPNVLARTCPSVPRRTPLERCCASGRGDVRWAGTVTAHAVRALHHRVVDVVIVLALEPPLLGALELRPGELVVYLGDGTVRIAGRALVAVVRTRPKVHLLGLGKT